MFTTHPSIFAKVQERMKNNITVQWCLPFINIRRKRNLRSIQMLISQTVFETLSALEEESQSGKTIEY
jgi:hypothetical protein